MPELDELLSRQMPHSDAAEQAVLGAMLIDSRCIPQVVEVLRPEDFYTRQHQEVYEAVYSMFALSKKIDPVTVQEQMRQDGTYVEETTRSFLLQLMDVTPTAANVMEYVEIVRDKALLRRVAETADEITAMIGEGSGTGSQVLEAAEQRIYAIRQGRAFQGLIPISAITAASIRISSSTHSRMCSRSARAKRFSEILPMLPSFMLLPNRADSTAPIWLLPSPPLPLMTIMRCPLLLGIRQ